MKYVVGGVLVILVIIIGATVTEPFWGKVIRVDLAILAATAIVPSFGLIFLGFQTFYQKRISEAQFIQQLAQDVDKNVMTETRIDQGGDLYELCDSITQDDKASLITFLTFFERLNYLIDNEVGSLDVFDKLFSYRFFILVHNPNVQRHLLLKEGMAPSWAEIFKLHKRWLEYRRQRSTPIPRDSGSESLINETAYR